MLSGIWNGSGICQGSHFISTTLCCVVPDITPLGVHTEPRGSFSSPLCLTSHAGENHYESRSPAMPASQKGGITNAAQLTHTVPAGGCAEFLVLKGGLLVSERERQWSPPSDGRTEKLFVLCVCMFTCLWVHICMQMEVDADRLPGLLHFIGWGRFSCWTQSLPVPASLVTQLALELPQHGRLWELCHVCLALMRDLGCEVQSPSLPGKHLMCWAVTSVPDKQLLRVGSTVPVHAGLLSAISSLFLPLMTLTGWVKSTVYFAVKPWVV